MGRSVVGNSGLSLSPERPQRTGVYPFWSPNDGGYRVHYDPDPQPASFLSHKHTQSSIPSETDSLLKEVKTLRKDAERYSVDRRNRQLLSQMNTVMTSMQAAPKPAPKAPTPYRDERFDQVLNYMQRQQETVAELVKGLRDSQNYREPQWDSPYRQSERDFGVGTGMRSSGGKAKDPLEERYLRIRESPDQFTKLLHEVNFVDDHSEMYINGDPNNRFTTTMSLEKKAELIRKMREEKRVKEKEKGSAVKKGKRYFRIAVYAVIFQYLLTVKLRGVRKKRRVEESRRMEKMISIYLEGGAKGWVMKAVRAPLTSILGDSNLDLDVIAHSNKDSARKKPAVNSKRNPKHLKLQVHIRGCLEGLLDQIPNLELPLKKFADILISRGTFIPATYFLGFEKSRVERDAEGALQDIGLDKMELLLCGFFVTRVLIKRIMLKARDNGTIPVPQSIPDQ